MRIDWDGRTLALTDVAVERVAVELDGCFFDECSVAADGAVSFRLPYSPSGHPLLGLRVRAGREGPALHDALIVLRPGVSGVVEQGMQATDPDLLLMPSDGDCVLPYGSDAMAVPVAVVVPVYNAAAAVEACLESVLRHTRGHWRLIVIDDASSDPAIAPLLARYAGRHGITVLRNDSNRGFTATANRGLRAAGEADVVLLNADTQVSANWLTGLRRAAHARPDIGSVTAVSDNAGAFSVPELERENPWPIDWTFDDAARALWHNAGLAYPLLPTGNGFCLYLRRAVINAVGVLDEVAFAQGYGEENDWCQRAESAGYVHVIAGNVLVHHLRTQSFGIERREALGRAGMAVLRERWPGYEAAVGATLFSFERRVLDWRVRRSLAQPKPPSSRVLRLVDEVPAVPIDAAWCAAIRDGDVLLLRPTADGWLELERTSAQIARVAASSLPHRQAIWTWLQRYGFDAVEILAADAHPSVTARLCECLGIAVLD